MARAETKRDYEGYGGLPQADIVAAGYETICPECSDRCELVAIPREGDAVFCPLCETPFRVNTPEHAYS